MRLRVPISQEGLTAALDAAETWAEAQAIPPAQALRLRLVAEELLANLTEHARWPDLPAGAMPPEALVELAWEEGALSLVLTDGAAPFDPRHAPAPAAPTLEGNAVGGLGLALVRRMSQRLDYGRDAEGRNRTALILRP